MDALTAPNTAAKPDYVVNDPTDTDSVSNLTSDFETFLQLLTVQLKNQDPSKPLDSTEFVAQLASFSAVEQQIATNDKLQKLIDGFSASSAASLAEWIGKEVRSPAAAEFNGDAIDVTFDIPDEADAAVLVATDANGKVVSRTSLELNSRNMTWYGIDSDGKPVDDGAYGFTVETYQKGELIGGTPANTFSAVTETRIEDDGIKLVFADGSKMPSSDVTAVRLPQSG